MVREESSERARVPRERERERVSREVGERLERVSREFRESFERERERVCVCVCVCVCVFRESFERARDFRQRVSRERESERTRSQTKHRGLLWQPFKFSPCSPRTH